MLLRRWFLMALAVLCLALAATTARAQVPSPNLPSAGGYQPIPNFSGPGAGLQFRTAINDRFDGNAPISPKFVGASFSNLPAEQDGLLLYCPDCQQTIPCTGGGSGAWAFGQNGQWTCTAPNASGNVLYSGASSTTGSLGINALTGSGTSPSLLGFSVNGRINVKAYGAVGDAVSGSDGTTTSGSTTFSSSGTSCTNSRVGEVIDVAGAGASGANLATTVASCSGNNFVMVSAAGTSISGTANWVIGHDDTTAIQNAWNAAKASGGTLFFPKTSGYVQLVAPFAQGPAYLVTQPLDFTEAEGVRVTGPGALIYADTGGILFDLGGDRRCVFAHLNVFEPRGLATPSTVGFFQARDQAANTHGNSPGYFPFYNRFVGNTVELLSESSANGGNGTVALYNVGGSESNTYVNNVFVGDTGVVLTSPNAYGITSPFYTVVANVSLTNNTFIGSNDFRSDGAGPALLLDGAGNSYIYGAHFGADGPYTNGTGSYAIIAEGGPNATTIVGMVEQFPWDMEIEAGDSIEASHFDFVHASPSYAGGFYMLANGSTATSVTDSYFRDYAGPSLSGYPLVENSGTNGTFTNNIVDTSRASMANMTLSGATWSSLQSGDLNGHTVSASAFKASSTSTDISFGGLYGLSGSGPVKMDGFGDITWPSGTISGENWHVSDKNGNQVLKVYTDGTEVVKVPNLQITNCAGTATLSSGAATVTNSCIATGRPIICTDNTDTTAVPCTAIPSSGSLALHGTGSDTVSWVQF